MDEVRRAAAGLAALLAVSLCAGLAVAGPAPQKSIRDGVFNADQVEAGQAVFDEICIKCHTKDTFGPDYMLGWNGASVAELFMLVQGTMPYETPGALDDEQYADVIVYLFSINGVEAGDGKLPAELNELWDISIDGPFTWKGSER
ncbi:MAG: cytochrome c [Acidobacteriota bacterium]|jgi:mono/diheme cytochrome c family protein